MNCAQRCDACMQYYELAFERHAPTRNPLPLSFLFLFREGGKQREESSSSQRVLPFPSSELNLRHCSCSCDALSTVSGLLCSHGAGMCGCTQRFWSMSWLQNVFLKSSHSFPPGFVQLISFPTYIRTYVNHSSHPQSL